MRIPFSSNRFETRAAPILDGSVAFIIALDRSIKNLGSCRSVYDDRGILILKDNIV